MKKIFTYTVVLGFFILGFYALKSFAYDLCMPCYEGDGGQTRNAGQYYYGQLAGYQTQCYYARNQYCWYLNSTANYWTVCQCPGDTGPSGTECSCDDPPPEPTITSFSVNGATKDVSVAWNINDWGCVDPNAKPYPDIFLWVTNNTTGQYMFMDLNKNTTSWSGTFSGTVACDHSFTARVMKIAICGGEDRSSTSLSKFPSNCCTNAVPAAPTGLAVNDTVGSTPANTVAYSSLNNVTFSWNNGTNWGANCSGGIVKQNIVRLTNPSTSANLLDYRPGSEFSSYNHIPSRPFTHYRQTTTSTYTTVPSNLNDLTEHIKCDGSYTWAAFKGNGYGWANTSSTFTVTGTPGPTVTAVTSSSSSVATNNAITFNVTATDPNSDLSWVRLEIYNASTGALVYSSPSQACLGSSCTKEISWTPSCSTTAGNYIARGTASDSCGKLSTATASFNFAVEASYNLDVTVNEIDPVTESGPDCSSSSGTKSGVQVTYTSTSYPGGTDTVTSNSSGHAVFTGIPASYGNVTLNASYAGAGSCETFGFYCVNGADQVGHTVDFTGLPNCGTRNVTIGVGETQKDSWETVFDGDVYARNTNVSVSCSAATVGGGFAPVTLAQTDLGGFLRSAGSINYDNLDDVYEEDGGFARDLDGLEGNSGAQIRSYDAWFHSYEFPDTTEYTSISNLSDIGANNVYKSGNLSISGSYNLGSSDAVSVVYVDGDLNITGAVTSSNGFIVFVVNGNVNISSDIGVTTYTDPLQFNTTTPADVTAGILNLGSVNFLSSGSGDKPIILDGFIMSRGTLSFNRDLLQDNDNYPAHVFRFYDRILPMLSDLDESTKTGLSTYDVQWIYEEE